MAASPAWLPASVSSHHSVARLLVPCTLLQQSSCVWYTCSHMSGCTSTSCRADPFQLCVPTLQAANPSYASALDMNGYRECDTRRPSAQTNLVPVFVAIQWRVDRRRVRVAADSGDRRRQHHALHRVPATSGTRKRPELLRIGMPPVASASAHATDTHALRSC